MILKKIPFNENAVTQSELQNQLTSNFSIENDTTNNQMKLKYAGQTVGQPADMSMYLTEIPVAGPNALGGVKISGNNLTIDEHGVLSAASGSGAEYSAGNGIAINDHVISLTATIPTKTSELQNDSNFLTAHQSLDGYATENWVENKNYLTEIPIAGSNTLGGVKISGNNLTIDEHGVLSAASSRVVEYGAGYGISINDYMISLTATIPTKTSELQNDSNFLTAHQPLTAYYTKTEIDQKIGDINTILDQINGEVY